MKVVEYGMLEKLSSMLWTKKVIEYVLGNESCRVSMVFQKLSSMYFILTEYLLQNETIKYALVKKNFCRVSVS